MVCKFAHNLVNTEYRINITYMLQKLYNTNDFDSASIYVDFISKKKI